VEKLKNAYALLIGVGKDIPVSAGDAEAIYNVLIDKSRAGYLPENIFLLTDEKATRKEIIKAFDALIEKTDTNASVMLYYSGHGGCYSDNTFLKKKDWKPEDQNQKYFHLCPFDYDPVNYENTWIKAEEVKEKIGHLKSRRLIFFLDCCHAAGITKDAQITLNSSTLKLTQGDGLAQHLDDGRGMSIISSCREDQLSYIMDGDSNSLYTKCMIEVLNGKGKTNYEDPYIRISEVVQYIFKKVPEGNPEQNPYANLQIYDDFILSYIPENLRNNNIQESEIATVIESTQNIGKDVVTTFRESETANSVVLFIHGFSGEASNTFANIPHFLIQDKRMDGWDMFPVGYSENINPEMGKSVWASLTDIKRNSTYLTTSLKHKFSKYKRIAIVAHSLGGLVAQQAILGLSLQEMEKISHLILFGTPSGGLSEDSIQKLNQSHLKDLSESGSYIKELRQHWTKRFSSRYPFYFRTVAATKDSYVPISSTLKPFLSKYRIFVEGDHFSMVNVIDKNNDSYFLVVNALTENKFFNQYSSSEEINIAMGEYDEVIKKLLPQIKKLDTNGLGQLIFALEGVDRAEEALNIAKDHVLAKDNSDLMGVIGGRYKRKYLATFISSDAENSFQYYSRGLTIAQAANDFKQIYYLAINMAFLSIFYKQDEPAMTTFAQISVVATKNDPFNSLWKLATMGEANIYLGNFEESKKMYSQAAKMSGIREKLSIYGNAYNAYTCLMHSNNPEEDFIKFLKKSFLS
jgi:pimeloyl-ACP methyl ester carboxylesterase